MLVSGHMHCLNAEHCVDVKHCFNVVQISRARWRSTGRPIPLCHVSFPYQTQSVLRVRRSEDKEDGRGNRGRWQSSQSEFWRVTLQFPPLWPCWRQVLPPKQALTAMMILTKTTSWMRSLLQVWRPCSANVSIAAQCWSIQQPLHSIWLCVCLSICPCIHLSDSVCLTVCLSVCLSVYPSVSLSL